jgi:hypothetical protein
MTRIRASFELTPRVIKIPGIASARSLTRNADRESIADSPDPRPAIIGDDPGTLTPINSTRPALAPGRSD